MGPNGAGKSTLAVAHHGQPGLRADRRRAALPRRGPHGARARRAGAQGRLPRLPVPRGDPGRLGRPVPAPGDGGAHGHRGPLGPRGAPHAQRVDGPARHGPRVRRAAPQRGVLRRRAQAQRGPAARHARAATSRCSTRPTRASTSTRCAPSALGVRAVRERRPQMAAVVVTHYAKLLEELVPDVVHVLIDGRDRRERRARARRGDRRATATTRSAAGAR